MAEDSPEKTRLQSMIFSVVCLFMGIFFVWRQWFSIGSLGDQIGHAKIWEAPGSWKLADCDVLAAGVACTEVDTGSTCAGYPGGMKLANDTAVPVFNTEAIASCPGAYWCAKEEDACTCDGEIIYAPHLFNGIEYALKSVDTTFKRNGNGTAVKCGTGDDGAPIPDPAPGIIKHCWCTPRLILSKLDDSLHKSTCDELATEDYENPITGQGQLIARRLLEENGFQAGEESEAEANEMAEADVEEDVAPSRRAHSSPRRRRTFTYSPWALVKVALPESQDQFSDDYGKKFKPQLACAYEFGVPTPDYGIYVSDGTYGGSVWDVEEVVKKWGKTSTRQCWVRTIGRAAEQGAPCAVAMDPPGSLQKEKADELSQAWEIFWVFLSCFVCCFAACIFVFGKAYFAVPGYESLLRSG